MRTNQRYTAVTSYWDLASANNVVRHVLNFFDGGIRTVSSVTTQGQNMPIFGLFAPPIVLPALVYAPYSSVGYGYERGGPTLPPTAIFPTGATVVPVCNYVNNDIQYTILTSYPSDN
jgi:hypothetical protein